MAGVATGIACHSTEEPAEEPGHLEVRVESDSGSACASLCAALASFTLTTTSRAGRFEVCVSAELISNRRVWREISCIVDDGKIEAPIQIALSYANHIPVTEDIGTVVPVRDAVIDNELGDDFHRTGVLLHDALLLGSVRSILVQPRLRSIAPFALVAVVFVVVHGVAVTVDVILGS